MTAPFPLFVQQVRDDEQFLKSYMENGFETMFKEVYEFISQFQKPTKKGIFTKTPLRRVLQILESVEIVLDRSKIQHYRKEMIPDIKNTFIAILHPLTPPEIRTIGVTLYVKLINILEDLSQQYVEDFEHLVFDFSLLPEDIVSKYKLNIQIDPELRIQNTDPIIRPNTSFLEHVEYVLGQILNLKDSRTSTFNCWWSIVLKRLIGVAFRSVTEKFNPNTQCYGINGQVPWELERIFLAFITKIYPNTEFLTCILGNPNTPAYLYAILNQCATDDIKHPEAFEFIINFIKLVCENVTVLDSLKKSYSIIFPHLISCVQKLFEYTFIINDTRADQRVNTCIDSLKNMIDVFYKSFDAQSQYDFATQLSSLSEVKNLSSSLHVVSILLSSSINLKIVDPKYWECIVKGGGCQRHSYLTSIADFSSFFAFNLLARLLNFKYSQIPEAIAAMRQESEWMGENGLWLSKLDPLTDNPISIFSFFLQYRSELTIPEISNDNSTQKVKLQPLNVVDWTQEEILQLMRVFIKAFDWTKLNDDIDLQFSIYLVGASFIFPLLKMTQVMPPTLVYDNGFLLNEFYDWLNQAVSTTVTNKLIVVHALRLLGDIICRPESDTFISDEKLAEFYLVLKSHIGNDNMKVKQTALVYACRCLLVGLRGSNLLLTTICQALPTLLISIDGGIEVNFAEKSAIAIAICSLGDCSTQNSLAKSDNTERITNKIKAVEFCFELPPTLRIPTLIQIITEECVNSRDEVIENCLTSLLKSLKSRSVDDVYSFLGLLNIFPELEKCHSGSVSRVLTVLLNTIEIFNEGDENLYYLTTMLACEALVDAAPIIDVSIHYKHLKSIAENWCLGLDTCKFSNECQQKLKYALLFISSNFTKFHYPVDGNIVGGNMENSTVFKYSQIDDILRLQKSRIVSDLPVARTAWNYKCVHPANSDVKSIKKEVDSNMAIPSPQDSDVQKQFTNHIEAFVTDLFANKLQEMGVESNICTPEEFNPKPQNQSPNVLPQCSPQRAPPSSTGHDAAAFMTSFNYFDILESQRVLPSISPESAAKMQNLDSQSFRHTIFARFANLSANLTNSDCFEDFKRGLGFPTQNGDIVNTTYGHNVVFTNERSIGAAIVVWAEKMTKAELVQTFSAENTLRIEIIPTHSGLFDVRTTASIKLNDDIVQMKRAFVTKRSLPLFVISQIMSSVHTIQIKENNAHEPFVTHGNLIREMKNSEFHSHPIMLLCPKKILQEVQQ